MSVPFQTELGQKGTGAAPPPDPFQTKTSTVSLAVWLRQEGDSWLCVLRSPCPPLTPGHQEPRTAAGCGHRPSFCGLRRCHQSAAAELQSRRTTTAPKRSAEEGGTFVFFQTLSPGPSYTITILSESYLFRVFN